MKPRWNTRGQITVVTVAFLSVCLELAAAAAAAGPDFAAAAALLARGIQARAFPGCTVAVGTDGKVLWSEAFGHLDYEHKVRVTRKTIYDLASVTKVAGTTSVYMRLVALGKLQISDPVCKHLPEFIELAPDEAERAKRRQVTVEHLLTHTGGLVAWKPLYRSVSSYPELLREILKFPLETEPGAKFRYSDLGMILLGEIASRAGGKPLPELERELVFSPLGMSDTLRNPSARLLPRIPPTENDPQTGKPVHGVVHDENARAAGGVTGHAGLFSTAEDLARHARELLRALDGRSRLFPKEVATDFLRVHPIVKDSQRALGWGLVRDADGKYTRAVGHAGFTGTWIWIDPDRKLYLVLLTNRVHPTRDNDSATKVRSEVTAAVAKSFDKWLAASRRD